MSPFRSFRYNFTLDNSNHVWMCGKLKKMCSSPKHWIYFKRTVCVSDSFFKINIYLAALEVFCMIRAFLIPIPFPNYFWSLVSNSWWLKLFSIFSIARRLELLGVNFTTVHVQVNTIPLSRVLTVLMIPSSAILRFSKGLGLRGPKFLLCVFVH